jgi:Domain of unknown function (DUF6048)
MCKYSYILIFSVLLMCAPGAAHAQTTPPPATDTTAADSSKVKKKDLAGHQLTIGVDLVNPVTNMLQSYKYGYEFEADYYMRHEFYAVAEGGWGGSTANYSDLQYNTTNFFARFGFNKAMLVRDRPNDWDMMFIGLRAGYANITKGTANYTITDSTWGNVSGTRRETDINAVWLELTGGMRVELLRNFFAGWNIRGKFMMNERSFQNDAPLFIAGYGKGDKNSAFDFDLYLSYAIRWDRKHQPAPAAPIKTP